MTTRRVLAMNEVHGTLLSTVGRNDLPKDRAEAIVSAGADAVFRMCLEFGFFHADPHPGNIFALEDGSITFIDCGMTGQIDPGTAAQLADLVQGVVTAELDTVLDVVVGLSDADPGIVNDRAFCADVWEFIGKFQGATLSKLDLGRMLEEFFEKIRKNRLRVPSDIVFLIKAITTIEGVGERLAPDFDLVTHVRPHIERLVKRQYGLGAIRRRLKRSLLGYAGTLERLPAQLRSVFYAFRRDRFTINLEHRGLDTLTETIRSAAGQLASAIFVAALLLGGAVLMLADSMRPRVGAPRGACVDRLRLCGLLHRMAARVEPVPLTVAARSPAILRPVLEVHSIGKSFPAVRALDGVSLRVAAGEVHGVIGENGAGKSTLMKILAGIERPDEGRLVLDGRPYDAAQRPRGDRRGRRDDPSGAEPRGRSRRRRTSCSAASRARSASSAAPRCGPRRGGVCPKSARRSIRMPSSATCRSRSSSSSRSPRRSRRSRRC